MAMAGSGPMSFTVRNTFIEVAGGEGVSDGVAMPASSPQSGGRGRSMPPKLRRADQEANGVELHHGDVPRGAAGQVPQQPHYPLPFYQNFVPLSPAASTTAASPLGSCNSYAPSPVAQFVAATPAGSAYCAHFPIAHNTGAVPSDAFVRTHGPASPVVAASGDMYGDGRAHGPVAPFVAAVASGPIVGSPCAGFYEAAEPRIFQAEPPQMRPQPEFRAFAAGQSEHPLPPSPLTIGAATGMGAGTMNSNGGFRTNHVTNSVTVGAGYPPSVVGSGSGADVSHLVMGGGGVGTDYAALSVGSRGHATRDCRPCAFARSSAGCKFGAQCHFCHVVSEHTESLRVRPCKGKRERLKRQMDSIEKAIANDPDLFSSGKIELPALIDRSSKARARVMAHWAQVAADAYNQRDASSAAASSS